MCGVWNSQETGAAGVKPEKGSGGWLGGTAAMRAGAAQARPGLHQTRWATMPFLWLTWPEDERERQAG